MTLLFAFLSAIIPPIFLLIYIYWKDREQPEPFRVLLRGVLYGCFSGLLSLCLSNSLLAFIRPDIFDLIPFLRGVFSAFYDAALPEETSKLIMLWLLFYNNKDFDESLDAIVYSVCIGMGFAGLENAAYVLQSDQWATTAFIRGLLAVPGHYIDAVLMGFFYALVFFAPKRFGKYWYMIWLVPFVVHGTYDSICFAIAEYPAAAVFIFVSLLLFSFKMHHYCMKCISRIIAIGDNLIEELHEEEEENKSKQSSC